MSVTHLISRTATPLLLAVVLALLPLVGLADETIPIGDTRSLPLGEAVIVKGAITVPSGTFASFLFDQGFAIQDESGGIYVRVTENLRLGLHRRVRVAGVLIEESGLLILEAFDVKVLRRGERIRPQDFATGDISEETEGLLVRVEGTITRLSDDRPFGFSIYVDDDSGETQIFFPVLHGFNPLRKRFVKVGNTVRATGYSGQFGTQYEVVPRKPRDLRYVP